MLAETIPQFNAALHTNARLLTSRSPSFDPLGGNTLCTRDVNKDSSIQGQEGGSSPTIRQLHSTQLFGIQYMAVPCLHGYISHEAGGICTIVNAFPQSTGRGNLHTSCRLPALSSSVCPRYRLPAWLIDLAMNNPATCSAADAFPDPYFLKSMSSSQTQFPKCRIRIS